MKTLIVGSWVSAVYEEQMYNAFKELSHDVSSFKWGTYLCFDPLSNRYDVKSGGFLKSIWYRFQNKFIVGPAIFRINRDLYKKVAQDKPDLIFFYRATHIWPSTIEKIKKKFKSKIVIYNNDDPFTENLPSYVYRNYLGSLEYADWIFSYRTKNLDDYKSIGYENTSILMSSYTSKRSYYDSSITKSYDIIFIGHYEDDGRDEALYRLMFETDLRVGLWGQNWKSSRFHEDFEKYMGDEIQPLFGNSYNETLNKSKVALVFFSKVNNDGYTRRCFEIPAVKTLMMSEDSAYLKEMFEEEVEAVYFKSVDDLVYKAKVLLKDNDKIKSISENGHQRLLRDGHEIKDRVKQVLKTYESLI